MGRRCDHALDRQFEKRAFKNCSGWRYRSPECAGTRFARRDERGDGYDGGERESDRGGAAVVVPVNEMACLQDEKPCDGGACRAEGCEGRAGASCSPASLTPIARRINNGTTNARIASQALFSPPLANVLTKVPERSSRIQRSSSPPPSIGVVAVTSAIALTEAASSAAAAPGAARAASPSATRRNGRVAIRNLGPGVSPPNGPAVISV